MKVKLKSKIQYCVDKGKKIIKIFPLQLLYAMLSYSVYLVYVAPVAFTITLAIAIFSVILVEGANKFFPLKNRWKYACLIGLSLMFLSLPTPTYAILEGFENAVAVIVNATGGGVDANVSTLIANILKLGIFVAVVVLIIMAFYNQRDEEKLTAIGKIAIALLAGVVVIEVAGNYIFASGGGGSAIPPAI
jgi:glucose-6-phosphate-specific signal transduction histidine kinase